MKLRLKILRVIVLIGLALCSPILLFYLIISGSHGLDPDSPVIMAVFIGALMIGAGIFLWYTLITQILIIELKKGTLYSKNFFTKEEKQIELAEITSLKDSFWNNTYDILSKDEEIRINKDLYSNISHFMRNIHELNQKK